MANYYLFKADGEVIKLDTPFTRQRWNSQTTPKEVAEHFDWEEPETSTRQLYYKDKNWGEVVMIWSSHSEDEINHNITNSLQMEYDNSKYKHLYKPNWGEGIRGDVVVKTKMNII